MNHTTELEIYRHKSDLELCRYLIEDAYKDSKKGHYDLVQEHLEHILEVFDWNRSNNSEGNHYNEIASTIIPLVAAND